MPKYRVVEQDLQRTTSVYEVEADSAEEAEQLVSEGYADPPITTSYGDCVGSPVYQVTEMKDA